MTDYPRKYHISLARENLRDLKMLLMAHDGGPLRGVLEALVAILEDMLEALE